MTVVKEGKMPDYRITVTEQIPATGEEKKTSRSVVAIQVGAPSAADALRKVLAVVAPETS